MRTSWFALLLIGGCGGQVLVPPPDAEIPDAAADVAIVDAADAAEGEPLVDADASADPNPEGPAVALAVGEHHNCAIDRSRAAWCWGANPYGEIGINDEKIRFSSKPSRIMQPPTVTGIAAGGGYTCVIDDAGAVWCWGKNYHGELADGTTTARRSPAVVPELGPVRTVSLGREHACAVIADGTVRCWGNNEFGELGDGTTEVRTKPVPVLGLTNIVEVAAGGSHTCARSVDGRVACFGQGAVGQLGNGSSVLRNPTPQWVPGLKEVTGIASGYWWSCALLATGEVMCWGANWFGQLGIPRTGIGSEEHVASPTRAMNVKNAQQIGPGGGTSCAATADGVWCWGHNNKGEIGRGSADGYFNYGILPLRVAGTKHAVFADVGHEHSCALLSGGAVVCWGGNSAGQLGDGTTSDRLTPTWVAW